MGGQLMSARLRGVPLLRPQRPPDAARVPLSAMARSPPVCLPPAVARPPLGRWVAAADVAASRCCWRWGGGGGSGGGEGVDPPESPSRSPRPYGGTPSTITHRRLLVVPHTRAGCPSRAGGWWVQGEEAAQPTLTPFGPRRGLALLLLSLCLAASVVFFSSLLSRRRGWGGGGGVGGCIVRCAQGGGAFVPAAWSPGAGAGGARSPRRRQRPLPPPPPPSS